MAHILLVEDERALARAVATGLRDAHHVVDVEHDGDSALTAALSGDHDVIVLDWMLPGVSGVEICRRLRSRRCPCRILMLTARDEVADTVRALDAGADDYLTKPFAFDELLARVRALSRRDRPSTSTFELGTVRLDTVACTATVDGEEISLTATEYRLLEALMRNAGRVMSRSQLVNAAWDRFAEPDSNAVEVHVSALRRKLERNGQPRIIRTVRGMGYVAREPAG